MSGGIYRQVNKWINKSINSTMTLYKKINFCRENRKNDYELKKITKIWYWKKN